MNDFSSTNYSSVNNDSSRVGNSFSRKRGRKIFTKTTIIPFALVGVVLLIVGFVFMRNATSATNAVSVPGVSQDKRVTIDGPKKEQKLNKALHFPLRDLNGKEVSKFTYEVQDVELRDEIIVKGQRASSVQGRTFLIVNLKITNNYNKNIQLNVKDYIRLIVNDSSEKLAADIHNDPVDVQAISTKYTRVGFPINDTDKNLKLQVGEITGNKETINLNL